jgi:hypothetical protein
MTVTRAPIPDGDLQRVGADHAGAEDDHVAGCDAGNAAEQDAHAALRFLKVRRAGLDRHAAGDFAHRCQQRQTAVRPVIVS